MFRSISFTGFALFLVLQPAFTQTKNQQLGAQRFSAEITIQASPARVWQVLTDAGLLTKIMDYEYTGGAKKFGKVGDAARVKVWGDASNFTLIRSRDAKELRFNLDPENGSYICSCSWTLSKSGKRTKVRFEERYTESGPQTKEDLAAQAKETNAMLQRLKRKAEAN